MRARSVRISLVWQLNTFERERERERARASGLLYSRDARLCVVRAYARACVRVAREYFHTEVNNTPRYPGQGWPTTTPSLLSRFTEDVDSLVAQLVSCDAREARESCLL